MGRASSSCRAARRGCCVREGWAGGTAAAAPSVPPRSPRRCPTPWQRRSWLHRGGCRLSCRQASSAPARHGIYAYLSRRTDRVRPSSSVPAAGKRAGAAVVGRVQLGYVAPIVACCTASTCRGQQAANFPADTRKPQLTVELLNGGLRLLSGLVAHGAVAAGAAVAAVHNVGTHNVAGACVLTGASQGNRWRGCWPACRAAAAEHRAGACVVATGAAATAAVTRRANILPPERHSGMPKTFFPASAAHPPAGP